MKKICVLGLWHLGLVSCVGFAQKGFQVYGIDFDKSLISDLKLGKPPIYEPALSQLLKLFIKKEKLDFSDDFKFVNEADHVVVAYDVPLNNKNEAEIDIVINACQMIAAKLQSTTPVIISSQMPLGTCEKIEKMICNYNPKWNSGVVYVPENLKLGQAIARFTHPDMIVLGANNKLAQNQALELYHDFNVPKITMDLRSAEMVKHALNTYLATSITFINEIANLSERLGVNALLVSDALKYDKRVGLAPLKPGLGFSGGTLARDVKQLLKFAKKTHYNPHLLKAIVSINDETFDHMIMKLKKKFKSLKKKTFGILGLTYKSGTSTLRFSPAVIIINKLIKQGAECIAYDPKASVEELKHFPVIKKINSITELVKRSDAIILLTGWPEFNNLNFSKLARLMKRPIIIDAINFLDPELLIKSGFEYVGFGR